MPLLSRTEVLTPPASGSTGWGAGWPLSSASSQELARAGESCLAPNHILRWLILRALHSKLPPRCSSQSLLPGEPDLGRCLGQILSSPLQKHRTGSSDQPSTPVCCLVTLSLLLQSTTIRIPETLLKKLVCPGSYPVLSTLGCSSQWICFEKLPRWFWGMSLFENTWEERSSVSYALFPTPPPAPKTMPDLWQHSINAKLMNEFPKVTEWLITKPWHLWPMAFSAGSSSFFFFNHTVRAIS